MLDKSLSTLRHEDDGEDLSVYLKKQQYFGKLGLHTHNAKVYNEGQQQLLDH